MQKSGVILLCVLILMVIGTNSASAATATIAGTKYYDYDKDGTFDGNDFGLSGWSINVSYLNGTAVPGASAVTGGGGTYSIPLDPYNDYYISEVLQPGWTNTTAATNKKIGFIICGGGAYEYFTNESNLNIFMSNLPDPDSYVLLGWNTQIGDAVSELPPDNEGEVFYPLGQWNAGQSLIDIGNNVLEVDWVNNTYVPFNAGWTYDSGSLYDEAWWNVDGSTVFQSTTHARPNAVPIRDIIIRLHSEDADYYVEVNNLTLKQGPNSYPLVNSHLIFNETGTGPNIVQDLYLVVRGSTILESIGGSDISNGFNLTGDVRFIWPTSGHVLPSNNEIKMDIMVGRYTCNYAAFNIVDFGNYIDGNISGYKLDAAGNGLSGWNISAYSPTLQTGFSNFTDASGYYIFNNVPIGNYSLNETLQNGWTPVIGNRTVEVNLTTLVLTNQNFTNIWNNGNLSGYKLDPGNNGLPDWTINVYFENGTLFDSNVTNQSGYFTFDPVPIGNYTVTETQKDGYMQLAPPGGFWTVNMTSGTLVNTSLNFTNSLESGNFSGYKLDPSNTGLPGWIISVYYQNGTLFGTNTTDTSGYFRFDPVPFGNYTVTEEQQSGWTQTAPPGGYWPVNMTSGTLVFNGLNFTNSHQSGNLSGYKLDPSNTGLPGWIINVYYQNGTLFGTNTTDTSGYFRFDPVPFGNYTVTEEQQSGWTQTAPPGGYWPVNMTSGTLVFNGLNFTNRHESGNLSGYKLDPSNTGLPGWIINVYYQNGTLFGTNTTDTSGYFRFDPVPFGNYTITEALQSGWTQTAPPVGYYLVNMTSGTLVNTGLNFTSMEIPKSGNISGIKFNDLNGDGHRDVNDVPLSGWVINLFYQNGTLFGNRTTNANGQFVFNPVPQGLYNLTETQQNGWTQTAPPGGYYLIEVNQTSLNFTLNFGNQEVPNPCACPTNAFFTWTKAPSPAHTITFTDASTGNPTSWMWSFGDGKFSNLRNPTHTYSKAGSYKVLLSVKSCDCSGSTYYTYYSLTIKVT